MKTYYSTILVVEDDPNDQLLIKLAFRKIGVTSPVHVVSGGEEAIAYMCGEGKYADRQKYAYPTFIMTDLKMPVDGFAVLDFLKKIRFGESFPPSCCQPPVNQMTSKRPTCWGQARIM